MEEEEKVEETAEGLGPAGSARKREGRMKREGAERRETGDGGTNTENVKKKEINSHEGAADAAY